MTQTLEQLSAAATELLPCPFCGNAPLIEDGANDRPWVVQCINRDCHAQPFMDHADTKRQALKAWNQRTGQLVAVSDDAVERVVAVIRDAIMSNDYPVSEWETDLALKAIAAMKDTQPALAAKGTGDE